MSTNTVQYVYNSTTPLMEQEISDTIQPSSLYTWWDPATLGGTPTTANEILGFASARYSKQTKQTRFSRPCICIVVSDVQPNPAADTFTFKSGVWLPTSDPSVEHYGNSVAAGDVLLYDINGDPTTNISIRYDVFYSVTVEYKDRIFV